jgi:hypothetical protein
MSGADAMKVPIVQIVNVTFVVECGYVRRVDGANVSGYRAFCGHSFFDLLADQKTPRSRSKRF